MAVSSLFFQKESMIFFFLKMRSEQVGEDIKNLGDFSIGHPRQQGIQKILLAELAQKKGERPLVRWSIQAKADGLGIGK